MVLSLQSQGWRGSHFRIQTVSLCDSSGNHSKEQKLCFFSPCVLSIETCWCTNVIKTLNILQVTNKTNTIETKYSFTVFIHFIRIFYSLCLFFFPIKANFTLSTVFILCKKSNTQKSALLHKKKFRRGGRIVMHEKTTTISFLSFVSEKKKKSKKKRKKREPHELAWVITIVNISITR